MSKKNQTIEISVYANRPKAFWADMGPFFARREVRREMPYLVDDDGYVWFVARQGSQVVGFASAHINGPKSDRLHLHGLYVVPEFRNNGLAERLVSERLEWAAKAGAKTATTTANPKSVPLYEKMGFEIASEKGQYRVMEANL